MSQFVLRTLADFPIEPGPEERGTRVHIPADYCRWLMAEYPHLFISEAILHLIDIETDRRKSRKEVTA